MSLGRALTTRLRSRFEDGATNAPMRTFSTKRPEAKPFDRKLISLPVELISSSNSLAYEAPDIGKITANMNGESADHGSQPTSPAPEGIVSPMSSASSTKSWDDSNLSSPALTSASSVTSHEDSRESSPANVDPNPMSSFFLDKDPPSVHKKSPSAAAAAAAAAAARETKSSFASRQSTATTATTATTASTTASADSVESVPEVPKRSLTHTKQTHQVLARKRSMSRVSEARKSVEQQSSSSSIRGSTDNFSTAPASKLEHDVNPFSAELEKVNELVEELSISVTAPEPPVEILDEESQFLIDNGFGRFTAADYVLEIQPLFYKAYGEYARTHNPRWI